MYWKIKVFYYNNKHVQEFEIFTCIFKIYLHNVIFSDSSCQ